MAIGVGTPAYHLVVAGSKALLSVSARVSVYHQDIRGIRPPFVLVSNHISHFDPPLLSMSVPVSVDWMADAPLFSYWWSRKFFEAVSAFPVDRDRPDKSVLKTAVERLKAGRCVGMFPEGGIRDGSRSVLSGAALKSGFAAVAQLAEVPLLPCVVVGTDRLYHKKNWTRLRRAPVWVGTGKMIRPDYSRPRAEVREEIVRAVSAGFLDLLKEMRSEFPMRDEDLPRSPQERMKEP